MLPPKKELPLYLSGPVLKKSKLFALWNKRTIVIDLTNKLLSILPMKSNKQLNLNDYTISSEGQEGKKYYVIKLSAKSPQNKQLRYKQLEFASLIQVDIMLWFENITLIMTDQFQFQENKQFTVPIINQKTQQDPDPSFTEFSFSVEKTQEIFIPLSNYKTSKYKEQNQISDKVKQFVTKIPIIFQEEITSCLKRFENETQYFTQISNKKNISIFQSNEPGTYRSVLHSQKSQQEIYEIILQPRVNHPHPMFSNIEIVPSDLNDGCVIIQADFLFQTPDGDKLKTAFYHSYSFEYSDALFVLCKTLKFIEAEHIIDSEIFIIHKIIKDPNNPSQTLLVTDANYKFKGEKQININNNTIQFLQNMIYIEVVEEDKEKFYFTVRQPQNQDQDKNNHSSDSSTFIDVKYNQNPKKSIVDQEMSWIAKDGEQIPTQENLIRLLEYIDSGKNLQICIECKHQLESKNVIERKHQTTVETGNYLNRMDYARNTFGGLLYNNLNVLKKQREVVISLLKRVGSNILNGRSIMNISLPVHIFDRKSFLQRVAASFGHIDFLEIGGNSFDIVEQLKQATCFMLSSFIMAAGQEKPFNPVLGETVQGRLNGHPIYLEQISHHPPVMSYMLYGGNYKLYGTHASEVNMGANTILGTQRGQPIVFFNNTKLEFKIIWNSFMLNGIAIGQRILNCQNRAYVYEPKSRLVCEIIYNPHDKGTIGNMFSKHMIDEISGAIYQVKKECLLNLEGKYIPNPSPSPNFNFIYLENHKFKNSKAKSMTINPTDIESYLSKVSGIWHSKLSFDNKIYWDIDNQYPHILTYEQNLLPSDSMFRQDILWLNMGDVNKAQEVKERIEVAQRHDQHLRKQFSKKK